MPNADADSDLAPDHRPNRNPDQIAVPAAGGSCESDDVDEDTPMAEVSGLERQRLVRLASRVMWNRGEAEDAVQEALLTAYEKCGQLREPVKRWSWLCRTVIQKCYEQGRQQKRRAKYRDAYAGWRKSAVNAGDPESGFQSAAEVKELVRHAIPRLSPRQQQVLILKDLEGMGYDEVAEILGISPSTARVHAKDAREGLRDLIVREHPNDFGTGFTG